MLTTPRLLRWSLLDFCLTTAYSFCGLELLSSTSRAEQALREHSLTFDLDSFPGITVATGIAEVAPERKMLCASP